MTPQSSFTKYKHLLDQAKKMRIQDKSYPFNAFFCCTIRGVLRETAHTRFLYNLLKYDRYILKSFLKTMIDKEDLHSEEWEIYPPETKHIDLLVKNDNKVIIIENKVNDACEQDSQIDRYVENYIENKDIYVLYLCRDYPHIPSEYSFKKFKGKCILLCRCYKVDIIKWIEELLKDCRRNKSFIEIEHALREYVQFMDIMFDSKYLEMEDNMKKYITDNYLDKKTDSEKINQINLLITDLKNLENVCYKLKYEYEWKNIQKSINANLSNLNLPELKNLEEIGIWDLPDAGIEFEFTIENDPHKFWAVVSYMRQRYIGIIGVDHNNNINMVIKSFADNNFSKLGKGVNSTIRYPYWTPIDNNKSLVDEYCKMIEILKEKNTINFITEKYYK